MARALSALLLLLALAPALGAERFSVLIPAAAGGGLDGTARAVGEALRRSGRAGQTVYQNLAGGGGGKALARFIETAPQQADTLLVSSTPIVLRALSGAFGQSWRNLVPVASMVGDYGVVVVRADSGLATFEQVLEVWRDRPRSLPVGGGSVRGSLDHVVLALIAQGVGIDPQGLIYVPYDGGGSAMAGLLSGEVRVASTGLGETVELLAAGTLRALAVTAPDRLPNLPDTPTLRELGIDVVFTNWRGFFAAPGTPPDRIAAHVERLAALAADPEWTAVRTRYGWADQFRTGAELQRFLEVEEQRLAGVLAGLGFASP